MKVYLVEKICDYEYGCTEVDKVFSSEKAARDYINDQPDVGDFAFWDGSTAPIYDVTMFEVEE